MNKKDRKKGAAKLLGCLCIAAASLAITHTAIAATDSKVTESKQTSKQPVVTVQSETSQSKTSQVKTQVPVFRMAKTMYKGDRYYLRMTNVKQMTKVKYRSSNREVAVVSKSGRIRAKKSGKTQISVRLTQGEYSYRYIIDLKVIVKTGESESKNRTIPRVDTTKKKPICYLDRNLNVGSTTTLKINNQTANTKITYTTTNASIASVSKTGKVKAKGIGTARIKIKVKQDGKTYRYVARIHVRSKQKTYVVDSKSVNAFFYKSVFVGDSVMQGFGNYAMLQGKDFLGGSIQVLASISYGVGRTDEPVSSSSIHPRYKGQQRQIPDALSMIGAKKVWIGMGMNDIITYGVDTAIEKYDAFIDRIMNKNPTIKVYAMTVTNMATEGEKPTLTNALIDEFNQKLEAYCKRTKKATFVDTTSYLVDSTGALRPELSSDHYVHQTMASYKIWEKALKDFAKENLVQELEQQEILQSALDWMQTAEESLLQSDWKAARKYIRKLENSQEKSDLQKRLKNIKKKVKK